MNIQAMMAQARKMQKDIEKTTMEIENSTYFFENENIYVEATGNNKIKQIKIKNEDILEDKEILEDIVVVAVNKEHIKDSIRSYNDLLNEKYVNNIVMIDDQRIVIGIALMALGYDMNDVSEDALSEAYEWLMKLKKRIQNVMRNSPRNA